uniref:Ubiquitin specific peptidase like 1 n=1 Tax=Oncorhynchus tshawytscha TaxID=74940 RepID=A0A8C8FVT1_ONCTS
MSCEGTGLGAPGPLAGYWEKIQERSASLETCPWCAAKGQTRALRSYRISIQEVITLCTDPQCLFPLVSRPLEDVLASLVPPLPQTQTGRKRKSGLEIGDSVTSPKSARLEEAVSQNESRPVVRITSSKLNGEDCFRKTKHTTLVQKERIGQSEPTDMELVDKTLNYPLPERGGANGYHKDSDWPIPEEMDQKVLDEGEDGVFLPEEVTPTLDKGLPLPEKTVPTSQLSFVDAEPVPKENARQLSDEDEEQEVSVKVEVLTPAPKKKRGRPRKTPLIKYTQEVLPDFDPGLISMGELVPVPGPHLFWKNEHSLGWLDTLLVALVHCRTLRDRRPIKRPTVGQPVWDLCERYDRACSLSTAYQHTDGVVRVPSAVAQRVQTEMQAIRMAIFKLLEPLLKCKLGQNERLVFVLPLLLGADSWAERLFQHEFDWQFQCNSCNKTLTTFTNVVSDWHPLNAANQSRCSKCNKMKQARMLVLERLSPVFVLHFAEGLPDNDLSVYSFTFQQQRYSITTVLQYDQPLDHLVSWIRIPDGSWLEFDDLKHPDCVSHTQLAVPPREIHVVFWENNSPIIVGSTSMLADVPFQSWSHDLSSHDLSLPLPLNDTAVVEALTVSDNAYNDDMDTTVTAGEPSIGSATLLDTFEGLSHDDVVTLTLVEVKMDSESRPTPGLPPSPPPHPKTPNTPNSLQSTPGLPPSPLPHPKTPNSLQSMPGLPPSPLPHPNTPNSPQSTPGLPPPPLKKPPPLPKARLSKEDNEALPVKAAEMYGGFRSRNTPSQPGALVPKVPAGLSETEALRYKLLKKLKAKKKKLEKLNQKLGFQAAAVGQEVTRGPDCADLRSPSTVSSSTSAYDSPAYDEFFADLLSPATTASNLSPDSTGFLDMLTTNGQEGGGNLACGGNAIGGTEALSAFDLFF